MRTFFMGFLVLGIGMAVGGSAVYTHSAVHYGQLIGTAMQMTTLMFVSDWSERSKQAYENEDIGTAIWAMENFAALLQKQEVSIAFNSEKAANRDRVLTQGRLAVLYNRAGDSEKYRTAMDQALALSGDAWDVHSESDLLTLINRLDAQGKDNDSMDGTIVPKPQMEND